MRHRWLTVVAAVSVVGAGCPVTEEMAEPEVKVYGRLKADVAYNSEATLASPQAPAATTVGPGDSMQLVENADGNGTLAITSRETRVGIDAKMGEGATGKVEVDFYGDPAVPADNKPTVLLRHAYVKANLGNGMSLLGGQTSDVFSPLLPDVINYGWGWNAGNPGYRRPQLRFEYAQGPIVAQVAAARSLDLESERRPDLQARVAYKHDKGTVGVSMVDGVADNNADAVADDVSGFALDFKVSLGEKVALSGEYFQGENLADYLAGANAAASSPGLKTSGLWVQVGLKVAPKLKVGVGYMFDDPDVAAGSGLVDRNSCLFVNLRGKLNEKIEMVLEVSSWSTDYEGDKSYGNTRAQYSMIYTF